MSLGGRGARAPGVLGWEEEVVVVVGGVWGSCWPHLDSAHLDIGFISNFTGAQTSFVR